MVDAIVLAAGAGRRVGGPKALLEIEGETYLRRAISVCRQGGCGRVWVVIRTDMPEVVRKALELEATVIMNPEPERGMFSSVHAALGAALKAEPLADGYLVFPVDHPRVLPETISALIQALPGGQWLRPTHGSRGGHPVVIGSAAATALLDASPRMPLRDALRAAGYGPVSVPVNDPGVLVNVNRPEDLSES